MAAIKIMNGRSVKDQRQKAWVKNLVSSQVNVLCPDCGTNLSVPGQSYFTSWNEPLRVNAICSSCKKETWLYANDIEFIG